MLDSQRAWCGWVCLAAFVYAGPLEGDEISLWREFGTGIVVAGAPAVAGPSGTFANETVALASEKDCTIDWGSPSRLSPKSAGQVFLASMTPGVMNHSRFRKASATDWWTAQAPRFLQGVVLLI